MNKELREWLDKLAQMQAPSVSKLLFRRGFKYEAGVVDNLLMAWQRVKNEEKGA